MRIEEGDLRVGVGARAPQKEETLVVSGGACRGFDSSSRPQEAEAEAAAAFPEAHFLR